MHYNNKARQIYRSCPATSNLSPLAPQDATGALVQIDFGYSFGSGTQVSSTRAFARVTQPQNELSLISSLQQCIATHRYLVDPIPHTPQFLSARHLTLSRPLASAHPPPCPARAVLAALSWWLHPMAPSCPHLLYLFTPVPPPCFPAPTPQSLPIPELVPFRLSRQLLGVLAPHASRHVLLPGLAAALAALGQARQLLAAILEVGVAVSLA